MEGLLKKKSYERMNVYECLKHPFITGNEQKTALISGLNIKLSFIANQAMERLFSLMIIGKVLEQQDYLTVNSEEEIATQEKIDVSLKITKDVKTITSLQTLELENNFLSKIGNGQNKVKHFSSNLMNSKILISKQVKNALDNIMGHKNRKIEKENLGINKDKKKPSFKISCLKSALFRPRI